ncbi:MAG: MiaB/RimO family radical SAM methylthiotransferase [Synergistaceae bacterium]|nr:MiaB/RimO family radical SAM methylthiotransferase [Synergistaceae bacterium]
MSLIYVHVFGCRSSLCEGEYIAGELLSLGHEVTEELSPEINAAVIVTCSVTSEADRKCRQLVRRVRKILGNNGVLAVCGCWSQGLDSQSAKAEGVDILAGSRGKSLVPSSVDKMMKEGRNFIDIRSSLSQWEELQIASTVMHSRAFVKIQDGCDHFCTYCVIPFLRGRPFSRPPENIIAEIERLISSGTKEIIFTGIHLGIYGREIGTSLAELVRKVSDIDGLTRLRLGSLEPFCLDDDLIDALAGSESFCHHIHLPLQSGDDEILKAMRRGYTSEEFVKVCEKARERIADDIHISSDILVGFPGEDDSAFSRTLDTMKAAGIARAHVFPYSPREGTLAAKMSGQIPKSVKISRTSEAISLGRKLFADYAKIFVGKKTEVLIERDNKGYTRHYIEASCQGNDNEIVNAEVINFDGIKFECMRRD